MGIPDGIRGRSRCILTGKNMIRLIFGTLLFLAIFQSYDALTCQKCGNAGECTNMTDNGAPKVCDEGEACMFGSVYSDDLRPPSLDYFRDCRPLNGSLPNCYNETLHEFKYSYCFCQEDNCNKDDNCV